MLTFDEHPVFWCAKCNFKTSGVMNAGKQIECPRCHSPLFRCDHCLSHTSGTQEGSVLRCDHCGKIIHGKIGGETCQK